MAIKSYDELVKEIKTLRKMVEDLYDRFDLEWEPEADDNGKK